MPCHLLHWWALKLHTKCQIWGTLSSWEMGCWATKCDIHCYWIGSYPTLDVWGRLEELLAAFTNPSLFIAFIQVDSQVAHKMTDFGYPPCKRTGTGCCTERYPLLLKCCIPFLGCICKMRGGFDSIYKPFLFILCHFYWSLSSNCAQNTRFGVPSLHRKWNGILWRQESIAIEVVHDLFLDAQWWWKHFLTTFTSSFHV